MQRVFITGANRGLGLEFVRQCLGRGDRVFAGCRQPKNAGALKDLANQNSNRMSMLELDVTRPEHIRAAAQAVASEVDGLDLLINNAGVLLSGEQPGNLQADSLLDVMHANAIGPLMVAQELLPLLEKGDAPKIVNVTSQLGSIARKRSGGRYSYSASKAALNMFTRALAFDVLSRGVIVVTVHPGWVKTDMGGPGAPLAAEESVAGVLELADSLKPQDAGRFLQWDGSELPW